MGSASPWLIPSIRRESEMRGTETGGRGGIRTHGRLAPTPVFKTGALNHSATSPDRQSIGAKATPFASFARAPASASGKPQNFNAVFTTGKEARLAAAANAAILTNAG